VCERYEQGRPVKRGESIGKCLSAIDILDVGKDIVDLGIADSRG